MADTPSWASVSPCGGGKHLPLPLSFWEEAREEEPSLAQGPGSLGQVHFPEDRGLFLPKLQEQALGLGMEPW